MMNFGTFLYDQARAGVPEQRLFEEVALSAQLGFDEAWFAEHHHSDYSILPSPNLLIAACSQPVSKALAAAEPGDEAPTTQPEIAAAAPKAATEFK